MQRSSYWPAALNTIVRCSRIWSPTSTRRMSSSRFRPCPWSSSNSSHLRVRHSSTMTRRQVVALGQQPSRKLPCVLQCCQLLVSSWRAQAALQGTHPAAVPSVQLQLQLWPAALLGMVQTLVHWMLCCPAAEAAAVWGLEVAVLLLAPAAQALQQLSKGCWHLLPQLLPQGLVLLALLHGGQIRAVSWKAASQFSKKQCSATVAPHPHSHWSNQPVRVVLMRCNRNRQQRGMCASSSKNRSIHSL